MTVLYTISTVTLARCQKRLHPMATTTKKMAADAAKCPRGLEPPMDGCAVLLYLWLRLRLKDAEQTPSNADPSFAPLYSFHFLPSFLTE